MNETLTTFFYIVGATYFVLAILFWVALGILAFVLYRKIKHLQEEVPKRLALISPFVAASRNPSLRKFLPLMILAPILGKLAKSAKPFLIKLLNQIDD